jgi:hypothetical protein
MNQLTLNSPLSSEFRATADALRQIVGQVKFLRRHDHPVSGYQEVWQILAEAPELAEALDVMARRLSGR